MKSKILTFIIGLLVGAIITTAGFLIYTKSTQNDFNRPEMMQMNEEGQMERPSNGDMEEPPEKPNDNNAQMQEEAESTNSNANI